MSLAALATFLIAAAGPVGCADPAALAGAEAERPFAQVRDLEGVDAPLVSSGTVRFAGDEITWTVTDPIEIVTAITPDGITQSVMGGPAEPVGATGPNNPMLAETGLIDLLSGDLSNIETRFDVSQDNQDALWILNLTPKSETMAEHVTSLQISGCTSISLISLLQANGDTMTIKFTD